MARMFPFNNSPAGNAIVYGGKLGKTIVQNGILEMGSAALGSVFRTANYGGNALLQNVFPSTDVLIDLYQRSKVDSSCLKFFFPMLGQPLNMEEKDDWLNDIWRIVVESQEVDFSIEDAIDLYRKGTITEAAMRKIMVNHGWWRTAKQNIILANSNLVDVPMAIALYRQGKIDLAALRKRFNVAGMVDIGEQDRVLAMSSSVGVGEAVRLLMMGDIDANGYQKLFIRNGIISDEDFSQTEKILEQVPGASELVRFALREVWDENVVRQFGYDEEFDSIPHFQWWMNASGYTGSPKCKDNNVNRFSIPTRNEFGVITGNVTEDNSNLDSWARAYWRAHWDLPSPTQGYQFLHRLRESRIARYQAMIPGVQPWTIDDLRLLLKTADYPKPFRDRLAAISFHTLTRVDIRRLYDLDVIDDKEVYEQNLDAGYNQTDAKAITEFVVKERINRRLKKRRELERKRAARMYGMGVINYDSLVDRLKKLGMTEQAANFEAKGIKLDIEESAVSKAINSLHRQFLRWDITNEDCKRKLRRLGVVDDRLNGIVGDWELEREATGRRVTASQVARFVARGLMNTSAAFSRLTNMGYPRKDAIRIIRVAEQDRGVLLARADRMAATTEKEKLRALEAEVRATQKQLEQAAKRLAKGGSPARLARWLKAGLVSPQEVRARLIAMGWEPGDADRFLVNPGGLDEPLGEPQEPLADLPEVIQ